ncbi:hypothetical protein ACJ73_06602 [Blastomyces percursus]|uniref:Uncharacterized protein n=1 Tax=Blastomyces percursus TaxID=1658174 RepID=A0A1J9R0Q7_9EURO|nr:hypothetical protein ACJ73_06602 [Blastomyces percursus]
MSRLSLYSLTISLLITLIPLASAIPAPERPLSIPGPPAEPRPRPGDGSGRYNSDGLCGPNDYRVHATLQAGVAYFSLRGRYQAARAMNHYLAESGEDLSVSVDLMMEDTPAFMQEAHQLAGKMAREKIESFVGPWTQMDFRSGWTIWNAWNDAKNEPHSYDWYYALGEYSYAVAGVVSQQEGGGKNLRYKVHVFDRYNWDSSNKSNTFGWGAVSLSHAEIGHLHQCGSAREYKIRGSSKTYTVNNYDPNKPLPPPK